MLYARGLSPNLPHAVHIHGKNAGELAFCPGANRRSGIVDDGLIETAEGLDDYGPVLTSFTTRGDTTAESALALDRFPAANRMGELTYKRTMFVRKAIARNLSRLHIVIHGEDLNRNGRYDFKAAGRSELDPSLPQEATIPANCGVINPIAR